MINYNTLKQVASRAGLSPSEILALAPQNDPFYVGAKGQLEKGKWFAEIYAKMGSPLNCHIRRVHYWLVTTNAVPKPNGKPYENTDNDWSLLNLGSKYARYLGLVPIENIIDRRNPDPIVRTQFWNHRLASEVKDSIDEESIIEQILDQFYCFNPSKTQKYMIELWAEKSTMNDVLVPICDRYGINLVTGLGELSITSVYLLANRVVRAKKPVRIFYISDFDPAGLSMPVAAARKIEYFARQYEELAQADIKLVPLMLTADQCREYKLPRTPIKETEKRKDKFEQTHGLGATELDAMEALYPGEMTKIIEEAVGAFFDVEAWNSAVKRNGELREQVRKYLVGGECEECEGRGKIDKGPGRVYTCPVCAGEGNIPGRIGKEILTDLDLSSFDIFNLPEGQNENDSTSHTVAWLYQSELEYLEQLDKYREFKAKGVTGISDLDSGLGMFTDGEED